MKIEELKELLKGEIINKGKNNTFKNIVIDSRKVEKGDLFIALRGKYQDGHNYIKDAIQKGACMIVTEENVEAKQKAGIIKVEDTLESLWTLAEYYRLQYQAPVIAVTGSVGKTTTKNLIAEVLGSNYKVLKSEKSFNNHFGVPLTLLELNDEYDLVLLELGMNHAGEISKLSRLCQPNVSVITNIGTSHIGNLGSKKNILKAKMEILDGMDEMGILILNDDDEYLHSILDIENCSIYRVGTKDNVDFKAELLDKEFKVTVQQVEYIIPILENYLLPNYLIAIQIGILFGLHMEQIIENIKKFKMEEHRLEVIDKGNYKIIDDSYNASFESFTAALSTLDKKNNYLFILGDMAELGKYSRKMHKKLGNLLKKFPNKDILLVGNYVKYIANKNKKISKRFENNEQLISLLKEIDLTNKTVFLKGSHMMKLEDIRYFLENQK